MIKPSDVSDLDFLSRVSLYGNERPGWKRVAYFAGLATSLRICERFSEMKVERVDWRLFSLVRGISRPHPQSSLAFANLLHDYTFPKCQLNLSDFENFGLSYGDPSVMYYAGMSDGLLVGYIQAPDMFRYLEETDWRKSYDRWLERKLRIAKEDLSNEQFLLSH